jgi:hypothetical protein
MITKWEGKDKKNRDRSLRAPEPQRTAGILEGWKNQRAEIRAQMTSSSASRRSSFGGQEAMEDRQGRERGAITVGRR